MRHHTNCDAISCRLCAGEAGSGRSVQTQMLRAPPDGGFPAKDQRAFHRGTAQARILGDGVSWSWKR